jgi:adenylate cyclase
MLAGHDREITCLFCDLRGFSGIAEKLAPNVTYRLLGEFMDSVTERIMDRKGVVIDFYGDGLAAMWNAPISIENHAQLACEAAQAMEAELPKLNESWERITGKPLRVGIGIHTGPAQVGNAGSRRRIKYGPRGHTVNLASRIEGATKKFGVPILISETTRKLLPPDILVRRLCNVRVVGVVQPIALFEVGPQRADKKWHEKRNRYEDALQAFEEARWTDSARLLESLKEEFPDLNDKASEFLRERALKLCKNPDDGFESTFDLTRK